MIAGAAVQVQSETTGARWRAQTDDAGRYSIAGLPGAYKITVRMPGLRTVSRVGAVVEPGGSLAADFSMELLTLHDTITVVSSRDDLDPSPSDHLLMTRGTAGTDVPERH